MRSHSLAPISSKKFGLGRGSHQSIDGMRQKVDCETSGQNSRKAVENMRWHVNCEFGAGDRGSNRGAVDPNGAYAAASGSVERSTSTTKPTFLLEIGASE